MGFVGGWTSTVGDDVVVVFEVSGEHAVVSGEMGAGAWHRASSNGRRRCRESISAPAGRRARSRRGGTVPRESRPAGGGFASALNACSEHSISPPSTHKAGGPARWTRVHPARLARRLSVPEVSQLHDEGRSVVPGP